jgi:hypothetical protein
MHDAGRPRPPAVWPVAVFTLLFSVFGAFSATRRAAQARRGRNSPAPYWIAFLATFVAGGFLSFVVATTAVVPLVDAVHESASADAVQSNVVRDGRLEQVAGMIATAATCTPLDVRGSDGKRDYSCLLTLDDGRSGTIQVTGDRDGNWAPTPPG